MLGVFRIQGTAMGWTSERARIAALSRDRQPDDPALIEARRNLRALRLEDHVRRVLAGEPPLTDEQRAHISAVLSERLGTPA